MAFQTEPVKSPIAIGDISIQVFYPWPEDPNGKNSIEFGITIHYDNGERIQREGNLLPHLTPQQISGLQNFMVSLRAQAEEQILG